jgi:hypothetical protein
LGKNIKNRFYSSMVIFPVVIVVDFG